MSAWKKLLATSAAAGGGLDVSEVFSTYLYDGNASTQTITNDIDLSNEGGLVWLKRRDGGAAHHLYDTVRGATKRLRTDATSAEDTQSTGLTAFNSDGFSVGSNSNINGGLTENASWTFREAPKFFDVVTYTGTGSAQNISHNLGSVPGVIITKRLDSTSDWAVYHRGYGSGGPAGILNGTDAAFSLSTYWNNTDPTSTQFTIGSFANVNASGGSYVAYLFAHNDGDGDFGPTGDQDIIKCGSYTGNGTTTGPEIDLGFEPQWLLVKNANDSGSNWQIFDVMRGMPVSGSNYRLYPNTNGSEVSLNNAFALSASGFQVTSGNSWVNGSSQTHIYIAIRRGPMAVPESATDVFGMDTYDTTTGDPTAYDTTFTVDMVIQALNKNTTTGWRVNSRLTGINYLKTNTTDAEVTTASSHTFDTQTGFRLDAGTDANDFAWMWKRAPSFCDVVAYSGTGLSNVNTVSHNLGVAPEMIWTKRRDSTNDWQVYHSGLNGGTTPEQYSISLNTTGTEQNRIYWNDTAPTSTTFQVTDAINGNGDPYIAYLFASLDGVSKVGSYSGTGGTNTQVIDCGFSAGARFVLLKRYNASGYDWQVFDTERGITSGNDAKLALNTTAAESTINWGINPNSSGFEVTGNGLNESGGEWIFYAIA